MSADWHHWYARLETVKEEKRLAERRLAWALLVITILRGVK